MKFEFTNHAIKSFKKLDKSIGAQILEKLKYWSKLQDPLRAAKVLEGRSNIFRYRVGDWRIVVSKTHKKGVIDILDIGHRSDVYEYL